MNKLLALLTFSLAVVAAKPSFKNCEKSSFFSDWTDLTRPITACGMELRALSLAASKSCMDVKSPFGRDLAQLESLTHLTVAQCCLKRCNKLFIASTLCGYGPSKTKEEQAEWFQSEVKRLIPDANIVLEPNYRRPKMITEEGKKV